VAAASRCLCGDSNFRAPVWACLAVVTTARQSRIQSQISNSRFQKAVLTKQNIVRMTKIFVEREGFTVGSAAKLGDCNQSQISNCRFQKNNSHGSKRIRLAQKISATREEFQDKYCRDRFSVISVVSLPSCALSASKVQAHRRKLLSLSAVGFYNSRALRV